MPPPGAWWAVLYQRAMPLWGVPVALWGYCAQRWRAGPAASPCSNVCTSLQSGKRLLHLLNGARWHPQRYPVELESSLLCAIDHLQPALAFAVTLLLRAGCWPSLENNVTYFGFEIPVNLLLSFALYWDFSSVEDFLTMLFVPVLSEKFLINASPACQISTSWKWYTEKERKMQNQFGI